ncbi:MAG: hypothetical protein FWH26_10770 [Oscillospiraceae bacterium]|nr:hypothetical protein [Oscillospiraceae bacterium]
MNSLIKIAGALLAALQWCSATLFCAELPHNITVRPWREYQTLESFGTSGCWWPQTIGDEAMAGEIARALYAPEGLDLSVYRYNVGGGEADNPACRIWERARRTESFYVYNEQAQAYEYDFTRDANARRMLDKAIAQGAEQVILFCNSPHFSMTASGQASGGLEANASNLPKENYQAFVDYLLTIADWFVAQGYPIAGISPINEPQWGWGGDWVGQEGCHYTARETVELLELFAVTMKARGVSYTLVGPESGELTKNYNDYIDLFWRSDILNEFCDSYAGHSYWMDNDLWRKWRSGTRFRLRYPDKKFEMSEWCELPMRLDAMSIDSGLYKANIIIQDLTLLNAVSWSSWTAVNGDGVLDLKDGELIYHSRYWAYKQFTNFIRPGAVRVKLSDSFGLASQLASVAFQQDGEIVLVIVNNAEKEERVKLRGDYSAVKGYTTDETRGCELTYEGPMAPEYLLPARSVSTLILT